MPVFHFKLTDTDSGESRSVSVAADSLEEAEATVLRQEEKKVNFELGADELKELQDKLKEGTLSGRDKGRLFSAAQTKPYKIQKAKEED